jgi:hypothetical protein
MDGTYRFIVHDRDGIFAPAVDEALRSMSLQVVKTPVRAPLANAHCERFIGTARARMSRLNDSAQRTASAVSSCGVDFLLQR